MLKQSAFLLALAGFAVALPAQASIVTLTGSTVDYTFDNSLLGLFGTPAVSGNTLYFTPTTFKAQSANGGGYTLTDSTVNIQVDAKPGYLFSKVGLHESGDYLLLGSGSQADVTGQIRVFRLSQPLGVITRSIVPTAPLDLTGTPTHNWHAKAGANLAAWNTGAPINVTVENLLLANTITTPSSLAFVQKKYIGLTVVTAPVPEAETWALMLAGLGLVGLQLRRSKGAVRQPGNA